MHFQQHRHQRLLDLASRRATGVQEVVLHQLLGERAAPLFELPGAQVHPDGTHDTQRINPMMSIEIAIFHRLQGRRQQHRDLIGRDHDAILAMDGKDAADEQRFEACNRDILTATVGDRADGGIAGIDPEQGRRTHLIREARGPQIDLEAIALVRIAARSVRLIRVADTAGAAARAPGPRSPKPRPHTAPAARHRPGRAVSSAGPRTGWSRCDPGAPHTRRARHRTPTRTPARSAKSSRRSPCCPRYSKDPPQMQSSSAGSRRV